MKLRTVETIRKELGESKSYYEGTVARKLHSDCSDKKRTPKFVAENEAIIDNDLNKSVRFTTRDTTVYKVFIRREVLVDIRYFSYKIRKDQFLSTDKRKYRTAKLFQQIPASLSTEKGLVFKVFQCIFV